MSRHINWPHLTSAVITPRRAFAQGYAATMIRVRETGPQLLVLYEYSRLCDSTAKLEPDRSGPHG